ncbi:MAG: hypothetical protein ACOY0T_31075 [Myxococcota bacterium]
MPSIFRDGFLLTKVEVEALCAFASTDQRRPDLSQIVFDASAGRIYASDGCTLVRVTVNLSKGSSPGAPLRFGVPRRILKAAARSLRGAQWLLVSVADGRAVVAVTDVASAELVVVKSRLEVAHDSAFPNYEQAIPVLRYEQRGASSAFNAEFLARLAIVQRASGVNGLDFFAPSAPLAGSAFEASGADATWLVVVMPFRSHRANALSRRWARKSSCDELSALANRKLSVPLFRRVVERLTTLSIAEVTCFEQLLATFVPCEPRASSHVPKSTYEGEPT